MLWQQCLLAFAQHYKTELTKEQKLRLKTLLRVQAHPMITPEIRHALFTLTPTPTSTPTQPNPNPDTPSYPLPYPYPYPCPCPCPCPCPYPYPYP